MVSINILYLKKGDTFMNEVPLDMHKSHSIPPVLYMVIPCYNEEAALLQTISALVCKISILIKKDIVSRQSRILFVDDGSKDSTWQIITSAYKTHSVCAGIKLAHNAGHQKALLAGMMVAKDYADIVISMDADLQHDIDAIDEFIEKYQSGADIVYGIRKARVGESFIKKNFSTLYYKIMRSLGVDLIAESADYRLMSSVALQALAQFNESNLFLRALIPSIGLNTATVSYEQHDRVAGESKYPFKKMLSFAWDGITSFSMGPVHLITITGGVISLLSLLFLVAMLITHLVFTPISIFIVLMGIMFLQLGIILGALGIVGEYVGKAYIESKHRPRYVIQKMLLNNNHLSNDTSISPI